MRNLEMWPDTKAKADAILSNLYDNQEFFDKLKQIVNNAKTLRKDLERQARIDPAILKEPMTF